MKIALVCPASLPATQFGGILHLSINLAKEFSKMGNDVTIFTTDLDYANNLKTFNKKLSRNEIIEGFNINRTHCWFSIFLFFVNPGMYLQLAHYEPDIIHTIAVRSFQSFIAAVVSKRKKIPLIVSDQSGFLSHPDLKGSLLRRILYKLQTKLVDFIIKQASYIIVGNEYEKEMFARFNVDSKIKIVRNGVDLDNLKAPLQSFKVKFGINEKYFLFVGRFNKVKGIDILLHAVNSIKSNPLLEDTKLVIMGVDDGFEHIMQQLINELKIQDKVIVIKKPKRTDVIAAYKDCEFIVLPSRWELSPLVPLEGFAFKKPSIGTKVHGTPYTIIDGENGILIETENSEQLANAILELLSNDLRRIRYGICGYELVNKICNSIEMAKNTLKIYNEIAH